MQSCLAQGELHGRAREVARAAEAILVGRRSGQVCANTPRCGLAVALDMLLSELKLPDRGSAAEEPRELRLDVMRSGRDRARAVVLRQMTVAGIPYATRVDSVSQGQRENLGERWRVSWQQGTAATIESLSRFGVTLPQVVEGVLQSRHRSATNASDRDDETIPPEAFLRRLEVATECGLHHLVRESIDHLDQSFLKTAGLSAGSDRGENPADVAERSDIGPGPGEIPMADRWRMILGVPPQSTLPACRAASRLDELYGRGRGEAARKGIANRRQPGKGGGGEAPEPTTVEWPDDLEKLFGSDVCQEVLGEAVAGGRSAAVDLLDPDAVTPSIELLQQVLSLAGGLPEARAEKLRRLSRRITEALAKQLAVRLRTALSGLSTPRPTRRHSRRLNLPRTIRENLANAYRRPDGRASVIAKRLVFNAPARREMDWHLTFVVDVSGSMTASVIYSALCASIFAELPALSVRFLAFSTEVIDLSGHVVDPDTLSRSAEMVGCNALAV